MGPCVFILLFFEMYIYFMYAVLYIYFVQNYFSLLILSIIAFITHIPLFVDSRNGEMSFLKFYITVTKSKNWSCGTPWWSSS